MRLRPSPTHEVTDAARFSNDTHRNPIAINTDSGTNNQVSFYTKHEEPPYAVLLVQSLPSSYNITLPVSTCLSITENTDLSARENPICPDGQKLYTLLFNTAYCVGQPQHTVEGADKLLRGGLWIPTDPIRWIENWSIMYKCARTERDMLNSLAETIGHQTLDARRIRTMVYPIINDNEVGLTWDPPSAGILGPQVGKLTEGFYLWSSSSEYANITRLVRSLKCPVRQKPYMHLFTQSGCRGKYVLSDSFGWNVTLFDEVVEEWSILFTCSDYEYAAGDREPAIEKMQELKFGDVEEEIAAIESLLTKLKLPEPHQISAIPQNATLAITRAFQPQIFQIPLSTCLSSTSDTHIFFSFVRIVTPPTCPPELPELWTLIYAKPGCLDLLRFSPTEPSYPLYKSLFENISRANPRVDGWSLGFVCHPAHFDGRVDARDWKMITEVDLILEGKGTKDVALRVVRAGAGERREEGLTEGVQLESQMKIEAAAQNRSKTCESYTI
ncbi:uncharacterized protein EAE97_001179 [Botrytis byssoidea]|uniref:Uncharacterized protein n=1 Tax=Botrytis byssoidea TaxID=139641 RepID=A0A9P5IWB7_9HELO|nr:uncharacterized protein EAE97_001179 [Botrytis byssoidea]KAF7953780.1 hypothetical protein EAE97_001179 [Botrytis byssoidea]